MYNVGSVSVNFCFCFFVFVYFIIFAPLLNDMVLKGEKKNMFVISGSRNILSGLPLPPRVVHFICAVILFLLFLLQIVNICFCIVCMRSLRNSNDLGFLARSMLADYTVRLCVHTVHCQSVKLKQQENFNKFLSFVPTIKPVT